MLRYYILRLRLECLDESITDAICITLHATDSCKTVPAIYQNDLCVPSTNIFDRYVRLILWALLILLFSIRFHAYLMLQRYTYSGPELRNTMTDSIYVYLK